MTFNYNPDATYDDGTCQTQVIVDFTVDANLLGLEPGGTVVINGTWNGWNGWGVVLSDEDGNGIWSGSGEFDPEIGQFEYVVTYPTDDSGWGENYDVCGGGNFYVSLRRRCWFI